VVYVRIICGVVFVLIFLLCLSTSGVTANPPAGGEWSEYRELVTSSLTRLEASINTLNGKVDGLRSDITNKMEEHSVAISRLRAQNGMYAAGISLAVSAIVVLGGGYIRRVRMNGKVIGNE